ncbi:Fe-S cluster assembly ATPase SufC [candidate division TM6 bacterium RIFCSPHIGHO2_12_FULL_32_22]|nr:MAG: Fe-S cluster assembly ATPase SufC [candidate division TM6 bacterium RIFCSPHIGHO2_12_FULL_32_22]
MLKVKDLSVQVEDKLILNNLNLDLESGKIHVLMGPNGSGKSTLANSIMGHPSYEVTSGSIFWGSTDVAQLPINKRAKLGFFISFQNPVEIPGLKVFDFLKESYSAFTGQQISVNELYEELQVLCKKLNLNSIFLDRNLNEGFSGGEKKRLEILQMCLLKPKVAIIDEVDSGLDVDSLKLVANAILDLKREDPELTIILITHYQRILNYIHPDFVYILSNGVVVKKGDFSLISVIESSGYQIFNS